MLGGTKTVEDECKDAFLSCEDLDKNWRLCTQVAGLASAHTTAFYARRPESEMDWALLVCASFSVQNTTVIIVGRFIIKPCLRVKDVHTMRL